MGEPHVISALRNKRAQVHGRIVELDRQASEERKLLAALDTVIRTFAPEIDPREIPPKRPYTRGFYAAGQLPVHVANALRTAQEPITAASIADTFLEAHNAPPDDHIGRRRCTKRVSEILRQMRLKGLVTRLGNTIDATWQLAE